MVEPIDAFEQELREHLQPRQAPQGFADRVIGRVAARTEGHSFWMPVWRWAMAAVLLGAVLTGSVEHDRRQRIEGERARDQVLLALRITGTTLNNVQRRIADNDNGNPDESRRGDSRTNNQE